MLVKPIAFVNKIKSTATKYIKCSKYTLNRRCNLLKKSTFKSSVALTVDLIIDIELDSGSDFMDFNYISFIDHYLTAYVLTNIAFFTLDSISEFKKCSDEECSDEECEL